MRTTFLMIVGVSMLLVAVLVIPISPQITQAEEPALAVRLTEEGDRVYLASEIEGMDFQDYGEVELVVRHIAGTDVYPVETIEKIDFIWDTSGIDTPEEIAALTKVFHLFQNQPNPFSPDTRIGFVLPRAGMTEIVVYDVGGRLIRTLLKQEREAGAHTVEWDGLDDSGERVAGGVYFYQLNAPGVEEARRMILLP